MAKANDPLGALVSSDAKAVDRAKLAELLLPYLVIDDESKEFSFHPALSSVTGNDTRIEILLAGAKARGLFFGDPDGMSPTEIIATGLMPAGSVKTSLKRLFDSHKIKKDQKGRYFLPGHRIIGLIKSLNEG